MPPKPDNGIKGGVSGGNPVRFRKHESSSGGESPDNQPPPLKKASVHKGGIDVRSTRLSGTEPLPNSDPVLMAISRLESKLEQSMKEQNSFRDSVEQRLRNMEESLEKKITTECESVRNEITIDIQMLTDKVNTFDTSLKKLQATNTKEINDIKARLAELENGLGSASNTAFNPDTTIVATGLGFSRDENIKDKAERFVRDGLGLDDISVINAMRTPFRNNKPGIVKIQFESKAEKERALDRRFNLKDSDYKRVFIRTSMSHTERLIHQNTKILLEAAGVTDSYTVLQSGRAFKKEILAQWKQNRNMETGTAEVQVGRG